MHACRSTLEDPTPAVIQDANRRGTVEFELLSLHTIALRLMAGAMGWPFVPSRSLHRTDLEHRNSDVVAHVDDPFQTGDTLVLRPLVTDIAIGHAVLGDKGRHAVFPASSDHAGWGLRSSRGGVLVVAESVVDDVPPTATGPRWVPASRVTAMCQARFAAHPYAFDGAIPDVVSAYGPDLEALVAYGEMLRSEESRSEGASGQTSDASVAYVRTPRSRGGPRQDDSRKRRSDLDLASSVYLAGTELVRRSVNAGARTMLEGSGKAALITKYAALALAEEGHAVDRVGGIGGLNGEPVGRNPLEAYGYLIGGPGSRSIGVLSALQVDHHGNINNSELQPGSILLAGSGGATDAGSMCDEIIVVTSGHPATLVRAVDFVTVRGDRVRCVIAGLCVFERDSAEAPLHLTRVLGEVTPWIEDLLAQARSNGWGVDDDVEIVYPPDEAQQRLVKLALHS